MCDASFCHDASIRRAGCKGVFSGCFAQFRARKNEGKKMPKHYLEKTLKKGGVNRGEKPKNS